MRQSILISLLVTIGLATAPLLLAARADFLGADVSSLAAGIVAFYPGTAASEIAKVLSLAWAIAFALTVTFRWAAACVNVRAARLLVFPMAPVAAYVFFFVSAALKYPAMFEGYLSPTLARQLFKLSFRTSPIVLNLAAVACLATPLLIIGLVRRRKRAWSSGRKLEAAALIMVTVGAALWAGRSYLARSAATPRTPHVLLIGVDSLRRDRLAREDLTPALRALVRDENTVSFDDHWVGVPRTFPSWLEIIQGRYAPRTGIRHMFPDFGARKHEFAGLVTTLRDAGYRTSVISDFAGDIFPRFEAGFQVIDAPKLTLRTMIRMSVDQIFPAFLPFAVSRFGIDLFPALKASPAFGDPAHLTSKVLVELRAGGSGTTPKFTTVFYSTAHFPYAAPYPYYSRFSDPEYPGPFRFQKNPELGTAKLKMDEREIAQVRGLYDGSVRAIDDELGRLFEALKASGQWDDTLVVVTADHGEDLFEAGVLQGHGEHLRGENVLRVPWIMKLPKSMKPATPTLEFTSRSIDIAPTVAAAVGLEVPTADGTNLMPWVTGAKPKATPQLAAYSETGIWFARTGDGFFQKKRLDYPGISGLLNFDQGYTGEIVLNSLYEPMVVTAKHRMLLSDDYKMIYMPTPAGIEWELFDRRADPENQRNVYEALPEVASRMRSALLAFIATEEQDYRLEDDYVVPR